MVTQKLKSLGIGFQSGFSTSTTKRHTLVMIHGAGGSSQVWNNQIHALKDHLNILALDLPGHGKTEALSRTLIGDYARWLSRTLSDLFKEPVFLMGHSLGGAIVQEMALSYPELLRGIILAATGSRLQVDHKILEGLKNSFEETVDSIVGYAFAPGTERSKRTEIAGLMKEAGSKVVHDDFFACDRFDRSKDLKDVYMPCLIICGEIDILTPPQLSEALNDSIKGSTLEILPSSGHMLMMENPKAFNQRVWNFVSGVLKHY